MTAIVSSLRWYKLLQFTLCGLFMVVLFPLSYIVTEGVCTVFAENDTEQINNADEKDNLRCQVKEMHVLIKQMNATQQHQQQKPVHNSVVQQQQQLQYAPQFCSIRQHTTSNHIWFHKQCTINMGSNSKTGTMLKTTLTVAVMGAAAVEDAADSEVQEEKRNIVGLMDSHGTTEKSVIVCPKATKVMQPSKTTWAVVTEGAEHDSADRELR